MANQSQQVARESDMFGGLSSEVRIMLAQGAARKTFADAIADSTDEVVEFVYTIIDDERNRRGLGRK
jgi:ribosome-binding protein aMBF1 (putative translation factor)